MKRSPVLSLVLAGLMAITLLFPTGCSQGDVTKAVSAAVIGLQQAQSFFPEARVIVADIKAADPARGPVAELIESKGEAAVALAIKTCQDYLAKPSDSNYQSIINVVSTLLSEAQDPQTLAQLQVKNPDVQKKITYIVQGLITALAVVDTVIKLHAKPAQLKAAQAKASVTQLMPYVDKTEAARLVDKMGYKNHPLALAWLATAPEHPVNLFQGI